MPAFGFETTALEVVKGHDLTGYEVIVTGGASGLGTETVKALASIGARVTLAARDITKAQAVADDLMKSLNVKSIEVEQLDLTSLKSIKAFVERYLAKNRPLNILINNAGVMATPEGKTSDGFEMQIGTNHIGHFALFKGLIPALKAGKAKLGKNSRVVSVGSLAHARGGLDLSDIHWRTRDYNKWLSYGQSKTANHLFSVELTKRYQSEGIISNSLHPGVIKTNLGRHETEEDKLSATASPIKFNYKTIPQGASTQVWAAVNPDFENKGGLYLNDTQIGKESTIEEIMKNQAGYLPQALDAETATKLWELTEKEIQAASQ
jgi:NAD(P)-dependent dehydrogenase (short-subunit alcohol dehydrogenase family)